MKSLKEIREGLNNIIEEQRSIVSEADEKNEGVLSEEQETRYNDLKAEFESLSKQEARKAELEQREAENKKIVERFIPGDANSEQILSKDEQRDLNKFSFGKAIRSLVQDRGLEGLEKEMHQEGIKQYREAGLSVEGNFVVPPVVLSRSGTPDLEKRDLTAGTSTEGQELVQTNVGSIINRLRNNLVIGQLGATQLSGLVGNVDFPVMAANDVAVEKAENAAAAESSPTFSTKTMSAKRLPVYAEYSRQLLLQAQNESVEAMLRDDLAFQIAQRMDDSAINGSGTDPVPEGILNTTGIGSVAGGTNGAAPTWANIVDLETEVANDNADTGRLAYLTNTKVRGKLKTTSKAGSEAIFVYEAGAQPLNGYAAGITNLVPSNGTKGTGTNLSTIIFGNFADVLVGQWGGMEMLINPYANDTTGLIRLNAFTFYDVLIRRAESFAAMTDAITS